MKKCIAKVLVLAFVLVMAFATVASAAVPNDCVIIGNQAYAIAYLTDPSHAVEIQQALDNAGPDNMWFSIDGMTAGWTSIFTGSVATSTQLAAFPEINYKDAQGIQATYASGNGNTIGSTTDFQVLSIE